MINNQQKDEIVERQKQYNSQYNNANELAIGVKNFNADDWKDIGRKFGLGVEKGADAYSLGAYSQLNKILGGDYEKQNQQYHKMAQEAGVGKWAEKNDLLLDTTASARGRELGLPKILPDLLRRLHHILPVILSIVA